MAVYWTDEALDDLAQMLAYYHLEAGPATAEAVERRVVTQIENLESFPERIRKRPDSGRESAGGQPTTLYRVPQTAAGRDRCPERRPYGEEVSVIAPSGAAMRGGWRSVQQGHPVKRLPSQG